MSAVGPHRAPLPRGTGLLVTAVAVGLLLLGAAPTGAGNGAPAPADHPARLSPSSSPVGPSSPRAPGGSAVSIEPIGNPPSTVVAGTPLTLAWAAVNSNGSRATAFSAACALSVTDSENGSLVPAWVNVTPSWPLARAANGSFSVPSSAWELGILNLMVSVAAAAPVAVQLEGGLLPSLPPPTPITITADLDHLALYDPMVTVPGARVNDTFWHVRDRFGNPAPGAFLDVELWTEQAWSSALVPVTWASGGTTGAWVNYSVMGPGNATLRVTDESNETLLGPMGVPALTTASTSPTASLPLWVEAAVGLLGVGGVLGIVGLLLGTRRRPKRSSSDGEEELRRLAEGRETVVELVRRAGSMGLAEIEAAWEPPPAPPAVADWVASLVTDGTLTATVEEGGRAKFSLADRGSGAPKVTLDEEAMRREVARRDAATNEDARDDRSD